MIPPPSPVAAEVNTLTSAGIPSLPAPAFLPTRLARWRTFLTLVLLWFGTGSHTFAAEPTAAGLEFFERKVRPLLAENCQSCHGDEKQKGKLRLDSPAFIRAGGERGAVIVAGQPSQSRILLAIGYQDEELKMPPKKRLSERQVADLTEWVKLGAPMPAGAPPAPATAKTEFQITAKDRAHWAFQPVKKPAPPSVKKRDGSANPIDAFIRSRLEAKGLAPNPPATKRELIRRAFYDLTGLPPSPADVEAFLVNRSPRAWEDLIDHLLDSPRYGEKWGRHWLDLVRFAESNSYERDDDKPHAWRFRDYVIRAFNDDKPYDRFLREQLAGDELPNPNADAIIATGFYRLGIWDDEPPDRELARFDSLDDIVATTAQVFLGLTVDCARCHNHKIDPIAQKDYYRLLSFFANVNHYKNGGPTDEVALFDTAAERAAYEQRVHELDRKRNETQAAIDEIEQVLRAGLARGDLPENPSQRQTKLDLNKLIKAEGFRVLGAERFARYQKLIQNLAQLTPDSLPVEKALAVTEAGSQAPVTYLLGRGNPNLKTDVVEPGFIEVLNPPKAQLSVPALNAPTSQRRIVLANWIASPTNPLTARVMVNRIWQHHFGRGIVRSPSNFGTQGDPPTHPELLDWLASVFTARGWSIKAMHRLIMTSQAYRQSSRGHASALQADPANNLFWRFDLRRLTAEEIRDSVLAVTGSLNLKMFGPGLFVDIPKEVMAGQSIPGKGWGKSSAEEQARRSIYIKVKRSLRTPILESFDTAETDRSTPVRFATVQPTQALGTLNGVFHHQQAEAFAARLRKEAGEDLRRQVQLALYLTTTRPPSQAEVQRGVRLIGELRVQDHASAEIALQHFCLMALNLNEMIYVD